MKKFREFVDQKYGLIKVDFPKEQYLQTIYDKQQIVLHHTASGRGATGDVGYWVGTKGRIATCVIIDYKGHIYQCFSSKYWGYHIGVAGRGNKVDSKYKTKENRHFYDKHSVGIEIDSWGPLEERAGKFYAWTGKEIPGSRVQHYPNGFAGHEHFEEYTLEQIRCVVQLSKWFCYKYDIPRAFNEDVFEISLDALDKIPGIYTHRSYRSDKSDIHPQPGLIVALKSISGSQI